MLCKNCSDVDIVAALSGTYQSGVKLLGDLNADKVWISRTSDPQLVWIWEKEKGCEFCEFLEFVSKNFKPDRRFLDVDNIRPCSLMAHNHTQGSDASRLAHSPYIKVMFSTPYDIGAFEALYKTIGMTDFESAVRQLPMKADLSTFRDRLHTCIQNHERCRLGSNETMKCPRHLRVIDCSSHNVILAPKDVQYAALSYQWGKHSSTFDLATNKKLPTLLPATIKDSIAATLSLGLQYLWVDAYCILQKDEEDFKNQIRQMDLIYQFASITIFAVTGTNSDSGLSGISYTSSRLQGSSTFRGFPLLTLSNTTAYSIRDSRWCSRGWTFQESFFSRRRLFFAEDQILFDCKEGIMAECHTYIWKERILPKRNLNSSVWSIYPLIEEFSKRHLTFPADIINAFEGVLNSFRDRESGVGTYWGVPIPLQHPQKHYVCFTNFLLGISWRMFGKTRDFRRRERFPSWSWAGWIGPIEYHDQIAQAALGYDLQDYSKWRVDSESDIESEKSWMEAESNSFTNRQETKTSQRILISGPSLRVILTRVSPGADLGEDIYLSLDHSSESYHDHFELNSSFEELDMLHGSPDTDTRACFAIYLYSYREIEHPLERKSFLLVSRKGSHWERVGIWYPWYGTKEEAISFEDQLRATPSFQTREFCIQ